MAFSFELKLAIFSELYGAISAGPEHASYIAYLSTRKVRDEYGNIYYGIDEDMRERLQAKLMRVVLDYKLD